MARDDKEEEKQKAAAADLYIIASWWHHQAEEQVFQPAAVRQPFVEVECGFDTSFYSRAFMRSTEWLHCETKYCIDKHTQCCDTCLLLEDWGASSYSGRQTRKYWPFETIEIICLNKAQHSETFAAFIRRQTPKASDRRDFCCKINILCTFHFNCFVRGL